MRRLSQLCNRAVTSVAGEDLQKSIGSMVDKWAEDGMG